MHEFAAASEEAARAGGKLLLEWADRFGVREKGPADMVTEADLASQQAIRELLIGRFPDHGFLGEEDLGQVTSESGYRWIVDPLDGTMNYVHRVPHYCVSIALERRGKILVGTVYDPVAGDCFTAQAGGGAFLNGQRLRTSDVQQLSQALVVASFPPRVQRNSPELAHFVNVLVQAQGMRRTGSAALNLCYVAAGRFDAFWATETHAWDIAAGMLLVQEAGGLMTNLKGQPVDLDQPRFLATATPELHAELLRVLQQADG